MGYAPGTQLGDVTAVLDDSAGSGNVITFGQVDADGVAWRFFTLDGWDSPDLEEHAENKTGADGAWDADNYYAGRLLTIGGLIDAPDTATRDAALTRLGQAVPARGRLVSFTVNETVPKQVSVRRSGRLQMAPVTDRVAQFNISLLAPDPRKYAPGLSAMSGSLGATASGAALPLVLPMALPGYDVGGAYFDVTNDGTYETPPLIRIVGPGSQLGIANLTTKQSLTYSFDLASGDALVIDVGAGTALLNGTAYRAPTPGSAVTGRFMLPPGTSQMQFLGSRTDSAVSPLLTMTWQSAWM